MGFAQELTTKFSDHLMQRKAREALLENGGGVRAERPYTNGRVIADLQLGILRSMPDRSMPFIAFTASRAHASILDPYQLHRAIYTSKKLRKVTVRELHERLAENFPGSHKYALENQRVKNITVIGDPTARVLALELDSPLSNHEARTATQTLEDLGEVSLMEDFDHISHISIMRFPGLERIPRQIIAAAEELAPPRTTLGSLSLSTF